MIDKEHLYYESSDFTVLEGYSILVNRADEDSAPHITIYNDKSEETEDITLFCASL